MQLSELKKTRISNLKNLSEFYRFIKDISSIEYFFSFDPDEIFPEIFRSLKVKSHKIQWLEIAEQMPRDILMKDNLQLILPDKYPEGCEGDYLYWLNNRYEEASEPLIFIIAIYYMVTHYYGEKAFHSKDYQEMFSERFDNWNNNWMNPKLAYMFDLNNKEPQKNEIDHKTLLTEEPKEENYLIDTAKISSLYKYLKEENFFEVTFGFSDFLKCFDLNNQSDVYPEFNYGKQTLFVYILAEIKDITLTEPQVKKNFGIKNYRGQKSRLKKESVPHLIFTRRVSEILNQ